MYVMNGCQDKIYVDSRTFYIPQMCLKVSLLSLCVCPFYNLEGRMIEDV